MDSSNGIFNESNFCQAYSLETFNASFIVKNDLFIINFNIRSFNANIDEFNVFLDELKIKPDIIILTETWFSDCFTGSIDGFTGFHCMRRGKRGGGVSIFVKLSLSAKITEQKNEISPLFELLVLKFVICNSFSFQLIALYRPPNSGSLLRDFNSAI